MNDWISPKNRITQFYSKFSIAFASPNNLRSWGCIKENDQFVGRIINEVDRRQEKIDIPLLLLCCIFIPFAKIESYRFSKQYEKALS